MTFDPPAEVKATSRGDACLLRFTEAALTMAARAVMLEMINFILPVWVDETASTIKH